MRPRRTTISILSAVLIASGVLIGLALGCPEKGPVPPARPSDTGPSSGAATLGPSDVIFTDVTAEAGIRFVHRHGGTGEKYFPETMGGGVLALDYDGDGDLDLYFIQSGKIPIQPEQAERNVLYQNDGAGHFTDVTEGSGLDDAGYGMGGAAADIDNDGDIDIYVTNFGQNRLYRNNGDWGDGGDGTFEDVTERAGVGDLLWGASAAFGDFDQDGLVDLYVVNYVNFNLGNHKECGRKGHDTRAYCHPDEYSGVDDVLYRNAGDGDFEDVTRKALPGPMDPTLPAYWISGSQTGKGLGVVWFDCDLDGDLDIYVANDSTRNFLFKNLGDGTFKDDITAGVGYNEDGGTEASMGVAAGDVDGDGLLDLWVVHLDGESNTLYRNEGGGLFSDHTGRARLSQSSFGAVGFGTNFLDYDNDGDLDIFVANGHIIDNIQIYSDDGEYAQADFLFRNDGKGRFEDVSARSGEYFGRKMVGRGSAVGDFDNDGDIDIVVSNNNQPAVLLRNDGGSHNHSIIFRTIGKEGNRDGIGCLIRITVGEVTQVREVRSGTSYLSQNDLRVHFGLGGAARVDRVEVHWPSGHRDNYENLSADHIVTLREGSRSVDSKPLR